MLEERSMIFCIDQQSCIDLLKESMALKWRNNQVIPGLGLVSPSRYSLIQTSRRISFAWSYNNHYHSTLEAIKEDNVVWNGDEVVFNWRTSRPNLRRATQWLTSQMSAKGFSVRGSHTFCNILLFCEGVESDLICNLWSFLYLSLKYVFHLVVWRPVFRSHRHLIHWLFIKDWWSGWRTKR